MRSPVGTLLETFSTLRNAAPVPLTSALDVLRLPLGTNPAERNMSAYGNVGTLFAIVTRITESVASARWRLWRSSRSGEPEDRVPVTRHAALDLLNKPNPFMPWQEFTETFQQHVELTGECSWIIGRDPRAAIPLELWPVRPDRISPVPHPEKFLSGYVYQGPNGQSIPLELNEVIQIKMPNPLDPYRGLGPVQSVLTDLDSIKYSSEWNKNFFRNSAEPGGIIEVPERLSDDSFNELRERWNEQHKGVSRAHRVAILEHGKWVDRKYSMKDMQFNDLRTASREIIREAFGFPKSMLGTVDDVNRANAEAGEVMFARWLVVPRLTRIRAALNNDLLPLFGNAARGLEFDFDSPVPEDRVADNSELTSRASAAKALVDAGFSPDDVCMAVGLPDMEHMGSPVTTSPPDAGGMEMAARQKWVAVEHTDDNTCQPCKDNNGKVYASREAAYKDYPGGTGYINCDGLKGGNNCRGTVRKAKKRKGKR